MKKLNIPVSKLAWGTDWHLNFLKPAARQGFIERVAAMEARQFQQPQQTTFGANQKIVDNNAPKIEDYDDFAEFNRAVARYEYKILREQEREQERIAAEIRKEKEAEIAAHKKWVKQLESVTANEEMPDFEDVLLSSDVIMTPIMQRAIKESDIGPKLAYYLAKNPDEAEKIATMDRENAIRTIGRIEERLATQKKTSVPTSAPEPIKAISTRTVVTKDPGKMSDAEYAKWRAQGRKRA